MTNEDFAAIRPKVLAILGETPRKATDLISELAEQGHEKDSVKDAVWWMIDDGHLCFSRGWKLRVINDDQEGISVSN